jgi:hypothetical protein
MLELKYSAFVLGVSVTRRLPLTETFAAS